MGGVIGSQTREAESRVRMSENNLSLTLRQDTQEVRTHHENLTSDLVQVAANTEAADLSEKNYRAVVNDYNLGLVTNLDVLVALSSSQDALRALDRSRYAAKLDNLRLEAASMMRPAIVEERPK